MSHGKNDRFAIPGLQGPHDAPKFDERVFADPWGTVELGVYGPVDSRAPTPSFDAFIYDETNHQVNALKFVDTKGLHFVRKELGGGQIEYRLFINYKDILESREWSLSYGSYKLTVCVNLKVFFEKWVIYKDHPKFGVILEEDLLYTKLVEDIPKGRSVCLASNEPFTMEGVLLSS